MKTTAKITMVFLVSLALCAAAQADELLVPADFNTIQAAIDSAYDGDTVIVADGTYTGPGNRDIDFLGKAITVISENGPGNCTIDCQGTKANPHRGFYFQNGEGKNSILDGFTITGGYMYGSSGPDRCGGGIYCKDESSPTIINCTITGNSAEWHGGGIYCYESDPNITNSTIKDNSSGYGGGGIYCRDSSSTITNCFITGNSAKYGGGGGGITCIISSPVITNCTITGNSAKYGGGIFCWDGSSPTITNCTINSNSCESRGRGGGIFCRDSSPTINDCIISNNAGRGIYCGYSSSPAINNCTINNNTGGGIFCHVYSSPTIINCTISDNWAKYGGGIFCSWKSNPTITNCTISDNTAGLGGGISCDVGSNPTITNCTISDNTAGLGGGISCDIGSSPTITNCTISGNWSDDYGGGISCLRDSNPTIINCTISGNTAGEYAGGISCYDSSPTITNCILWGNEAPNGPQIYLAEDSNALVNYTDVQGGQTDVYVEPGSVLNWGPGNIDLDPCFVEPGYWDANDTPDDVNDDFWVDGDYYLLPDSPCIDAGDPNYVPEPNETDIDGNPRIIGGRIDMGAYETNYIQATMKLTPQALSCDSKGNFVKAHFILPEGFLPEDVDVNEPAWAEPMGAESEYIKVLGNDDGLVNLEVVFDREAFCETITETGEVEITVIGSLTTSRYFYATDTIRIKPRR